MKIQFPSAYPSIWKFSDAIGRSLWFILTKLGPGAVAVGKDDCDKDYHNRKAKSQLQNPNFIS